MTVRVVRACNLKAGDTVQIGKYRKRIVGLENHPAGWPLAHAKLDNVDSFAAVEMGPQYLPAVVLLRWQDLSLSVEPHELFIVRG